MFYDTNRSPNTGQLTRRGGNQKYARELINLLKIIVKGKLTIIGALVTVPKSVERRFEELEIGKQIETHQIVKLQNTEQSPGDLSKHFVTHTPG